MNSYYESYDSYVAHIILSFIKNLKRSFINITQCLNINSEIAKYITLNNPNNTLNNPNNTLNNPNNTLNMKKYVSMDLPVSTSCLY